MRNLVIFLMVGFIVFSAKTAKAQLISFADNSKYWPDWRNNTSDDNYDTIGIPNFTGGEAEVTSGRITKLTFNQSTTSSPYWNVLSPGDLFIDLGANQNWDYVVDLASWATSGPTNPDAAAGNYNIYSTNLPLNSTNGYILSGTDNSGGWSGFLIRDNHPVALKNIPLSAFGTGYFTGWGNGSTNQYTFNLGLGGLPGGGLDLGTSGKFTLGWGVNCANDVVYETLNYTPVPEPNTIYLLGTGVFGLVGLAGLRKRRKA